MSFSSHTPNGGIRYTRLVQELMPSKLESSSQKTNTHLLFEISATNLNKIGEAHLQVD
jgi:hypothetical protein